MRRKSWTILCLSTLLASVSVAQPANKTVAVTGEADVLVDRANIQWALDSVPTGGTVILSGLFLLDGESLVIDRTRITLEGDMVDDDDDGTANEDWADGEDNDGDGLVDEDDWNAELRGLDDGSGGPAWQYRSLYNRTLRIQGGNGTMQNLTIRGIKFDRGARGIDVGPDHLWFDGFFCDDLVPTDGFVRNLLVEDNLFQNNRRAFQIYGGSHGARVRRNTFVGTRQFTILLIGDETGCVETDGSIRSLPIGPVRQTRIEENLLHGSNFGVYTDSTSGSRVRDNVIVGAIYALVSDANRQCRFERNRVTGAFHGFDGALPSDNVQVRGNSFGAVDYGVFLGGDASGFTAADNSFEGVSSADYYLDETTTDNLIIVADPETTVVDLGTGNTVVGPD